MKVKDVKIDEDIWWELSRYKVEWKLKRLSDVIRRIVKERKK